MGGSTSSTAQKDNVFRTEVSKPAVQHSIRLYDNYIFLNKSCLAEASSTLVHFNHTTTQFRLYH